VSTVAASYEHERTYDAGRNLIFGRRQDQGTFGRRSGVRDVSLNLDQPIGLNDQGVTIQVPPVMGLFPGEDRGRSKGDGGQELADRGSEHCRRWFSRLVSWSYCLAAVGDRRRLGVLVLVVGSRDYE
jgi:hypothetical protein